MSLWEEINETLSAIAHNEDGKGVLTAWGDLKIVVDRYSFKCNKCKNNKYYKKINSALRWAAREDINQDVADLWTRCGWYTKKEAGKCKGCKIRS